MTQGERSVKRKRRQNSNGTKTIAGSPLSCATPGYSKANLGIIPMESLFAGQMNVFGNVYNLIKVNICVCTILVLLRKVTGQSSQLTELNN